MTRFISALAALLLALLVAGACAPLPPAQRRHSAELSMNRVIAARFPGAKILDEAEFASTVVGRMFRYRVSSEIIVNCPGEHFYETGRYSVGHRVIGQGTYSLKGGVVTIECSNCYDTFLGLGRTRIFFRHQGKLLMANANGEGSVVELIPDFLKTDALPTPLPDAYVEPMRPAAGSVEATRTSSGMTPLTGDALRLLFSTNYNVYLTPRSGDVIVSHPRSELFRPNGTYWRSTGRTGLEATYAVEGDLLCVHGDRIPKQCRKVIPQTGKTYLLIDISNNSQALMDLSQVK